MSEKLMKCLACNGRGYLRCECWPGDCLCGYDEEDCDECGGEGIIDDRYDDYYPAPMPAPEGEAR